MAPGSPDGRGSTLKVPTARVRVPFGGLPTTPQTPGPELPRLRPGQAAPTPPGGTAHDPAAASPPAAGSQTRVEHSAGTASAGPPCGTIAAWQRHHRQGLRGDQIDPACRAAHNAYTNACRRKAKARGRRPPPCTACGRERPPTTGRRGWCDACYGRWLRGGRPADGPPPSSFDAFKGWREDFAFLREQGEGVEVAAQRVGIAVRTAQNWESKRKAGAL